MHTPRFPIYLKLTGGHSIYRITSETSFTEVQRVGRRSVVHSIEATTWPERLRIADMLENADGSLSPATEAEFEEHLHRAKKA